MKSKFLMLPIEARIAIFVVILVLFYLVFKFAKGFVVSVKEGAQNKGELLALEMQGIKPTYNIAEYEAMADDLERAMKSDWLNPSTWGTRDEKVFNVFAKLFNDVDFLKLNAVFGIRQGANLKEWIESDMSESEINKINNFLKTNGLSKRI